MLQIDKVSATKDFCKAAINPVIRPLDFDCITNRKLVLLSLLDEIILNKDIQGSKIKELVCSMVIALDREVGKNDIMHQILWVKLGPEFSVSRKGQNFNSFVKSRQDLCIEHVTNAFKIDTAETGFITSGDATFVKGC